MDQIAAARRTPPAQTLAVAVGLMGAIALLGWILRAEIRRRESAGERTPIVGMTANSMSGDRDRCVSLGMDGYLSKPFRGPELESVLAQWRKGGDGASAAPAVVGIDDSLFDASIVDGLLRTTDEDKVRDIVERFLSDGAARLEQIRQAIAQDDRDSVQSNAHALRGSSAMLGANGVSERCSRLEAAARTADPTELEAALVELEDALTATRRELEAQLRIGGVMQRRTP